MKQLVVIGDQYHYVFDAPPALVKATTGDLHEFVFAAIPPLNLDDDEKISGSCYLVLKADSPTQAISDAKAIGFKENGWRGQVSYEAHLKGGRYKAVDKLEMNQQVTLNKTYKIEVYLPGPPTQSYARLALTPITVAADGVLLIGSIPLMAITVGVLSSGDLR